MALLNLHLITGTKEEIENYFSKVIPFEETDQGDNLHGSNDCFEIPTMPIKKQLEEYFENCKEVPRKDHFANIFYFSRRVTGEEITMAIKYEAIKLITSNKDTHNIEKLILLSGSEKDIRDYFNQYTLYSTNVDSCNVDKQLFKLKTKEGFRAGMIVFLEKKFSTSISDLDNHNLDNAKITVNLNTVNVWIVDDFNDDPYINKKINEIESNEQNLYILKKK